MSKQNEVFRQSLPSFAFHVLNFSENEDNSNVFQPSDDQAIYCNKLTQALDPKGGGGGGSFGPPNRFSKRLQSFGMEVALD